MPTPDTHQPSLLVAISLAHRAHRDQVDKAGEPYLYHVLRVGISLLPDHDAAVVGILHDVLEDCGDTELHEEIRFRFPWLFQTLQYLCRPKGTSYEAYIQKILTDPLAVKVKLADLADNSNSERLERLRARGIDTEKLEAKYVWATEVLRGTKPRNLQKVL